MPNIQYAGYTVQSKPNETLLECLLRSGLNIDFSCKSGVCHRCMLKCTVGEIPESASKKLPYTHQGKNYLLACECIPTTSMTLEPKSSEDIVTQCIAISLSQNDAQTWHLTFEAYRDVNYQRGQYVIITDLELQKSYPAKLISDPETDTILCVELQHQDVLQWKQEYTNSIEGMDFYIRGPLPLEQNNLQHKFAPNPDLWMQLGGDEKIRAILTTFYQKVYADEELSHFFERVTIDRIIGKQFAFLKENIAGEQVYFGEQPRTTHHWMVISDRLFEHRMELMRQALLKHDVPERLIIQFEQYEYQFKTDIVKSQPWLKQIGNLMIDTEQYEECILDEATICDYCEAEIPRDTLVKFHKRIGKLACKECVAVTSTNPNIGV